MLKLLQCTNEFWGNPSLKGIAIVGAQHIMESTLFMFRNFIANGLDPRKTFLIGKCYSTSQSVYKEFYQEGVYVCPSSFSFHSHESYDLTYKNNIKNFLRLVFANLDLSEINKLIILDDGGHLIDTINSLPLPNIELISIEQTSSGINYLTHIDLNIPVFNVAKSQAKLELETPFIVESSLKRLWQCLGGSLFLIKNVLILGHGSIGKEVEKRLSKNFTVRVYDPQFTNSNEFSSLLSQADLIIGCSGTTSLKYTDYRFLKKGVFIASFSSSDREFDAHHFRRQFPLTSDCLTNFDNRSAVLFQSGFPINFWGSPNNIPLEKIQLTLSLLTSSVYQAVNNNNLQGGIYSIDPTAERKLMATFTDQEVSLLQDEGGQTSKLANLGVF